MERRVLLAVILSFAVLYGYQLMFPPPPEQQQQTQQAQQKPPQASKVATAPNASAPEKSNPTPSIQPAAPSSPAAPPARDIVVENADVRAVFTTRGAVLKSWELKKYRDDGGQPLEIIAGHAPADAALPFTLATDDASLSTQLASATFTTPAQSGVMSGQWAAQFDYADASGVRAQKTFAIAPEKPYVVHASVSLSKDGQSLPAILRWGPALGSGLTVKSRSYNPPPQPLFYKDGKVSRVTPAKIAQQPMQEGTFGFAGVDDHYFITALVKPKDALRVQYAPVDVQLADHPEGAHYVDWSVRFPGGATADYFVGPKDFDVLAAVDRDLVRAIDFGMFAWIVVPLLRALKWINSYVGNYGWSIILLTVFINLVLFPLRHKSVVSMRKMQEVQPEVKAIQERYKNLKMSDPARAKMNEEMMALYKTRGVNPASGCVPMLLSLPVLFAFYSMLSVAIELRGAPFILQIHDLSSHDPWFVWPALMGITMFVQQKMTPSTADPVQARMMLIMPFMLTAFMAFSASGLVIYWTISNLWGIGQQMITNKLIGPATVRTVRPPAERQLKNAPKEKSAGGGRTDQAKERKQ
jgi:YidC/Oxa1 family membrane protein insertase